MNPAPPPVAFADQLADHMARLANAEAAAHPPLALVDQEAWLNEHGLLAAAGDIQQETEGEREDRLQVKREETYGHHVIGGIMKEVFQDEGSANDLNEIELQEGASMIFVASDERSITDVPLRAVVSQCAYVAMILRSKGNWKKSIDQNGNIVIHLSEYPVEAVQLFTDMLMIEGDKTIDSSVPGDVLMDCCRIAHFLCAESILNATHDELIRCVDAASCLSLCQLGEELGLSVLFEASLSKMMDSLDMDGICDDLTPELLDRIAQIKGAINTSLHSGSRLYFGSMEEYIAIFAERVEYFKERLLEAREKFTSAGDREDMSFHSFIDTLQKITRQEKRLNTLQVALKEQRKLFLSGPREIKRPEVGKVGC
jgi:hypothetical protein